MPKSLKQYSHHLDKRLRFRFRLYIVISVILLGVFVFNLFQGTLRIDYGIIAVLVGIGIGILTSRIFHTSWNKDTEKVVGTLDRMGILIIIVYVFFELMRNQIVGYFTHGIQVGAVGFAVLAGIMFGRVIGTRGNIIKVLREQELL